MSKANSKASSQSADTSTTKNKSTVSYIDKDPFYKSTIVKLRAVLELQAELVVYHILPTAMSMIIVITYSSLFHQKFYHVQMNVFGTLEFFTIMFCSNLFSGLYIYQSRMGNVWLQGVMANGMTGVFHIIATIFLLLWTLTPGTNVTFKMDFFVLGFILWNYFWFGIAAIGCPIPIWGRNAFVIIFAAMLASFSWVMFATQHLIFLTFYQAVWDVLFNLSRSHSVEPHKRGMCFSHAIFLKKSKRSTNSSQNSKDSKTMEKTEEILFKKKSMNISNYPQSGGNIFKLRMRTQSMEYIRELRNGLPINKEYGSDAVNRLRARCADIASQGSHISLNTLVFYVLILVYAISSKDFVASFFIGVIIGFIYLVKCMLILFVGIRIPTKPLILALSFGAIEVINYMVTPCFKHIAFARIVSTKVMHDKFDDK